MFRACKGMFWKIQILWQSGWGWRQLIQIIDALPYWDQIKLTVNIKFHAGRERPRNHGLQSVLLNSCVCCILPVTVLHRIPGLRPGSGGSEDMSAEDRPETVPGAKAAARAWDKTSAPWCQHTWYPDSVYRCYQSSAAARPHGRAAGASHSPCQVH